MNRVQKQNALHDIFMAITKDGEWSYITNEAGQTHRFRAHGYPAGPMTVYIVEAYSGNGHRPGDTIGTVSMHNTTGECGITPLTFKRYLQNWVNHNA